ncbi:hypothetical protein CEP51_010362 [Fusarium floridanum]|uniref:Uncharacterized protein n=1 Tax=Fusarium floridanum TaxID=1325733 RepID=A0A428REP9_9HYPO|nr:hypothetical protein CEP51_010362 [Fusarium floridanum]
MWYVRSPVPLHHTSRGTGRGEISHTLLEKNFNHVSMSHQMQNSKARVGRCEKTEHPRNDPPLGDERSID